jgi:hypothetical protein
MKKNFLAGFLSMMMAVSLAAPAAFADDVTNNLDASVDAAFEAMGLSVGGAVGVNTYSIVPRNGDGKNGCNLIGGTTLTVSVSSSNTGVATVSPTPLTFTSCGDSKVVTITPVAIGTANITLSQVSNTTGGTFALGTASFTVNVSAPLDTTAPSLALPANITAEATGPSGAVVNFSATATDDNPVNPVVTCVPASGSTFPLGETTVGCSATDIAGNTAVGSFTVTVVDTTAPEITVPSDITAEQTSPAGAAVTFSASAVDIVDGEVTPVCTPASGDTFAAGTTVVTCTATDAALNSAEASFNVTVQDTIKPTIALTTPTAISYTFHQIVNANYSCADSGSGVASCVGTVANGSAINTSLPLGSKTFSVVATDVAGNSDTTSVTYTLVGYTFGGFKNPLTLTDKDFKKSSTIPVKFVITDLNGAPISGAVATLKVNGVPAVSSGGSNSGMLFRYDASAGQYIFNLSTKSLHTGVNTLLVTLDDGTTRTATFTIK